MLESECSLHCAMSGEDKGINLCEEVRCGKIGGTAFWGKGEIGRLVSRRLL